MKRPNLTLNWPSHLLLKVGGLYQFNGNVVMVIGLLEFSAGNGTIFLDARVLVGESITRVLLGYFRGRQFQDRHASKFQAVVSEQ